MLLKGKTYCYFYTNAYKHSIGLMKSFVTHYFDIFVMQEDNTLFLICCWSLIDLLTKYSEKNYED